ncbi:ATP-binding protein [Nonomuraea sp. PA05]|uniref:ATP-binding protein n=1 Tax=Nonomuraea sp. PA05 TaxID=2604466 RepID=UPI0011D79249|nr:ATP-binding protein [Nonomuraea sp. PA05]TYB63360.1 ATP-binding protein [Nonomuraea sp. PA05]
MVIDEIQRAPGLLLAIKAQVDHDPRPGRFLLTGSSRLLGLKELPDTPPGRMETIELWPFAQGEIDGTADRFGFVLMELARQLTWSDELLDLYQHRTKDGTEVDAVLENRQGRVVGVEVKAASTVRADDLKGLKHLADRLGDDFVAGVVLYTGTQALPFRDRMRAMPVGALWEVG